MTFVITSACVGVCDTACVEACPVDCIAGPVLVETLRSVAPDARIAAFGRGVRMFIDPDACIDCGACEPACPVRAIVSDSDLSPAGRLELEAAERFFRR